MLQCLLQLLLLLLCYPPLATCILALLLSICSCCQFPVPSYQSSVCVCSPQTTWLSHGGKTVKRTSQPTQKINPNSPNKKKRKAWRNPGKSLEGGACTTPLEWSGVVWSGVEWRANGVNMYKILWCIDSGSSQPKSCKKSPKKYKQWKQTKKLIKSTREMLTFKVKNGSRGVVKGVEMLLMVEVFIVWYQVLLYLS